MAATNIGAMAPSRNVFLGCRPLCEKPLSTPNGYNKTTTVGSAWDDFASESDGRSALATNVIGGTIFDLIDGFDTPSFLNAIFFAVRSKQAEFYAMYRCDDPGEKCLFRMRVSSVTKGGLRVDHALFGNRVISA